MLLEQISILHLPIALCETAILALFLSRFLGRRYRKITPYLTTYSAYFTLNILISNYSPEVISLFTIAICFLLPFLLYKGTHVQRIICAGLITAYSFVAECLTMVAISFALGYSASEIATSETVFYIGAYISKVLQFLIAIIITQNKKAVLLPANNRYHLVLLVIVWTCVGLSFGNMLLVIQSDSSASLIHLLSEIAVATLSVLMFYVFQSFQIHALQKERTALIEQQLWQEEQRFSLIDEQFQEIRSIKHDLTIHMTSIRKLLHEDNNSAAIEYLDDYFSQTSHALTRSITSKPSVDALISEKAAIAESEGVKFDIETEKLATININPVHLNIILGNALTNAIEACRQLHDDADRYISLGMKTEGDNLCIRVTNSSPSITIGDDELPVTSKNDITHHGFGLSTVRRLAKQYNGSLLCEYADGEFTFFALMMNKF